MSTNVKIVELNYQILNLYFINVFNNFQKRIKYCDINLKYNNKNKYKKGKSKYSVTIK